jgi:hypothetical protein
LARLEPEARAIDPAARTLESARQEEAEAFAIAEAARRELQHIREVYALDESNLKEYDRTAPPWWSRLFATRRAQIWQVGRESLFAACLRSREDRAAAAEAAVTVEQKFSRAKNYRQSAERTLKAATEKYSETLQAVEAARKRLGGRFVDEEFLNLGHAEKHQATPWLSAQHQLDRDAVFQAAMDLHKAFLDAAAKPLRQNLGALMMTLGGSSLSTPEKRALLPDLWSSLFLVVPLVSTAFASVQRMLGGLPEQGLGWLLVDEAGQALPQAAVGAILRSRRAVIVGDPVQIEPIVPLPESLTQAICRHFAVDADRFNAPGASVQTLADSATPYVAEFHGKMGSRTVGVPLLVHRRCAEPMFGISNAIAYDRLMVHATPSRSSKIGEVLGPSAWLDVRGSAVEKWCPEEGVTVLNLLRKLAESQIEPDLYVITPFVVVAQNLRKLVSESGFATQWLVDPRAWTQQHIGTVHTVQGREAEAVIFVLGAPAPQQSGARNWAGGRPNLLNVAVTRAKEKALRRRQPRALAGSRAFSRAGRTVIMLTDP